MNVDESRSVVAGLVEQIAPDVDLTSIDPERDMRREVDLDSLDFQTLVEQVAEATGVEIPETDYPQVRSLTGMSEYIAAHVPS